MKHQIDRMAVKLTYAICRLMYWRNEKARKVLEQIYFDELYRLHRTYRVR